MKKIKTLTNEQINLLPVYRDKWIKVGLDTSPLNHQACIDAVCLAYKIAKQPKPKYFIFADGPVEAIKIISAAKYIDLTKKDFEELSSQGITALSDRVKKLTHTAFSKNNIDLINNFLHIFYGQHEVAWASYYQFFNDNFGIGKDSEGICAMTRECGWVWMYANLVIISAKPIFLSFDSQNRLHNEKRAAVEYADGTKIYAFNGITIPEKWVLERETMDPSEILSCQDTDKRVAGIALYGYSRLKNKLDYKILEGDPNTDIGALVTITIPGLRTPGRFLEAICPRNGSVFLGVPETNPWDDNAPITDALGAQAFLARLPRSAFETPPIRT